MAKFLPVIDDSMPTRTRIETQSGVLIGTPAYMSPEQLLGVDLDKLWDLWAFSVFAYEALTGALPFAPAGTDWRTAVIAGRLNPLSKHVAEPPAVWQTFFDRCFASDPSNDQVPPASSSGSSRTLNVERQPGNGA